MFRKVQNKIWSNLLIRHQYTTKSNEIAYSGQAVNKIIITRIEEEEQFALLVDYDETV